MNEPIGRFGSLRPARLRRMERESALIASSCATTDACSSSSIRSSRDVSASCRRVTGMPVQRLTMKEISSSPSTGRCDWRCFSHSSCFLRISPCSSRSLSRSDAARSKFWSRTAASLSVLTSSSCSLSCGDFRRRHLRGETRARAGFVDDVDGLVGQEAVGDVALRQLRCGNERRIGDRHR